MNHPEKPIGYWPLRPQEASRIAPLDVVAMFVACVAMDAIVGGVVTLSDSLLKAVPFAFAISMTLGLMAYDPAPENS